MGLCESRITAWGVLYIFSIFGKKYPEHEFSLNGAEKPETR